MATQKTLPENTMKHLASIKKFAADLKALKSFTGQVFYSYFPYSNTSIIILNYLRSSWLGFWKIDF